MSGTGGAGRVVYGVDDRPPPVATAVLGFQHVVAMLLGNVTPPLLIAGALGLPAADTARLLQGVLLLAGAATIVQAYPIGPVGGRIPVIMGTSVAFVGALIGVGGEYGLAAVFGACLVGAGVEVALGAALPRVRRFFPPLVNGVVVVLIGLTLIPVGVDYAAGGVGAADYAAGHHLAVAGLVLAITLGLNQWARGFLSYASMLVAVVVGTAVVAATSGLDLAAVGEAGWFAVPRPLAFGLEVRLAPVLVVALVYVVSAMETLGDIAGTMAAVGREPTDRELAGGLVADGAMSALAALFSAFPNTSYSQNVGLVHFTGIASRHVTAAGGAILIGLGLVPKVAALFAAIPASVIGGAGLMMFAMIFASGAAILRRGVPFTRRNMVILAVAVGLGLGVEARPEVVAGLPQAARTFFGEGLVTGGVVALGLNLVLPRREEDAA